MYNSLRGKRKNLSFGPAIAVQRGQASSLPQVDLVPPRDEKGRSVSLKSENFR